MEVVIFFVSSVAALAVPLGIIATVQYCANVDRVMGFKKLLIFSWSLALLCIPFSFGFLMVSVNSASAGNLGVDYLFIALSYIAFGWIVCSLIYGKPIVPKFSDKNIKLP